MGSSADTVRAARLVELARPLQVDEVELPAPGKDEVRVELRFGGVNPIDRYIVEGQVNLIDAIERTLTFTSPEGKEYRLNDKVATLLVRPRGWHLDERHVVIAGRPVSGSLFDFGLYFFHNAKRLLGKGSGPYFYLPKLESHLEARLWNDVFNFAQDALGVPRGTVRATVLIEKIGRASCRERV